MVRLGGSHIDSTTLVVLMGSTPFYTRGRKEDATSVFLAGNDISVDTVLRCPLPSSISVATQFLQLRAVG